MLYDQTKINDELWFGPFKTLHSINEHRKKNCTGIEKHQKVSECKTASYILLIKFAMHGDPVYLQIPEKDPPDLYLLRRSLKGAGMSRLEITSFDARTSSESLAAQIKRTKGAELTQAGDNYIFAIEWLAPDYDLNQITELIKYTKQVKVQCPVWIIKEEGTNQDIIIRCILIGADILAKKF